MALEVKIPPMGESIISGILAQWHVHDGDIVKKDQPLFELETDKITSEGTAEAAGKISLKVEAGAEVKIGEVVAVIDTAVTDAPSAPAPKAAPATAAKAAPAAPVSAPDKPTSDAVSPAVRRLAAETGIDPAAVTGTGKAGRVTKGDLLAAAEAKLARIASAPAGAPSTPPAAPTSAA